MPNTIAISGPSQLVALSGRPIGTSSWHIVDQERVNLFAAATGDHQWIHVDVEASRQGPFGGTIVHGYLTLCLAGQLSLEVMTVVGTRMAINYGLNRVRFPAALRVGSRVRVHLRCHAADLIDDSTVQCVFNATVEAEGLAKPVCIAERITRFVF